uniref:Uncharacterized protein n=1 Tax=Tanacetum cinerariifolium TaxID=118510 RepID=A0A699JIU7_TANCI|nr:hypothetical protein [Tanacetum cinerariifolium]
MITPYELWTKRKPILNYLRVWGCRAVVRLLDLKLKTLGKRGIECIFVRYDEYSKAFRFFVIEPNESVLFNSIVESKDAISDKNRFSLVPKQVSVFLKELKTLVDQWSLKRMRSLTNTPIALTNTPIALMGNNTWVLADLPLGCKPIGCKWIFKRKLKVDGTIEKFKAMLVIQGFKQNSRIYYFDTYALVAHISAIRLLITIASSHNLIIHQMDVKTSFLNDDLNEEVYMNQPHGFIMPGNGNYRC